MRRVLLIALLLSVPSVPFAASSGQEAYEKGDYEKALEDFQGKVERDPKDLRSLYNLGNSLYRMKRFEESAEAYGRCLQQKSDFAKAWYNLGLVRAWQHRFQDSLEAFQKALEHDPGDDDAKKNIEILERMLDKKEGEGQGTGQEGRDPGQEGREKPEVQPKGRQSLDGKKDGKGDNWSRDPSAEKAVRNERALERSRRAKAKKELGLTDKQIQDLMDQMQQWETNTQRYFSKDPKRERQKAADPWGHLPPQQRELFNRLLGKSVFKEPGVQEDW